MRPCDTVAQRPIPYLTLYHCITLKDNRVTTLCTPWTTLLVSLVKNAYAYVQNRLHIPKVPNLEADILNISKFP